MTSRSDDTLAALLGTLGLHLALAAGLYFAGGLLPDIVPRQRADSGGEVTDLELPAPRPPAPEPAAEPEEPAEPEPTPPDEPPPETRAEPPPRTRQPVRTAATEPPPVVDQPAPGPVDNSDSPAPVYRLPDTGAGGSIPVPVGRPPSKGPLGTGGTGTNTGGGGTEPTATGPPAPVSVAAIKRRARPIGDTDFVDARKDYPAEAKRLGIEGAVKVRLIVDDEGRVTSRKLVVRLGHGLDELAMKLANRLRFEPVVDTNDRPVRSVVVWTFSFTLPR